MSPPWLLTRSVTYDQLIEQLVLMQYRQVPMVFSRGEFARRGGIIDVFAVNHTHAVRAEFEDQQLLRLQSFEVGTQCSLRRDLTDILILPCDPDAYEFFGGVASNGEAASFELLSELKEGKPVVHVHHGIGIFEGLKYLRLGPLEGEFLYLRYQGADRIYVPLDQIFNVHAYQGTDNPPLHALSDPAWERAKDRVRASTDNIAQELLEVYRQRLLQTGYRYEEDTAWQIELEASFAHQDTPDQRKVTEAVKRDMESPFPMDRLVCGDVGYGKTEIAVRAAFKAAESGKQVALLVPTTVLAQQHFHNFKQRLEPFGVTVEVLSRFVAARPQKEILARLREGKVDVVIGTHRLLQPDVTFKSLGLLIVDEEQRFGVRHKERLKQLHQNVDVLTMTATPIPRTLYLSLAGTRDLSVLETAPQKRQPVRTVLSEFKPKLVAQGIRDELARGGQVFFLHNRVADIETVRDQIQQGVPEAALAVAHGGMRPRVLEQTMLKFLRGEIQVLVCTTIVENGIDVPNANTIFIDDADGFGLAQIHQLRGRVGRSDRQAVAYLLYRKGRELSTDARARLTAIREYTALGSGYQLALKDLEFRGAGNLLGTNQSGKWQDVGLHLYLDILNESVASARGETRAQPGTRVRIDPNVKYFIPDTYIANTRERLAVYYRLMACQSESEVQAIVDDLQDRYGKLPQVVERLLQSVAYQMKSYAEQYGPN